jgi:hypothetical protein
VKISLAEVRLLENPGYLIVLRRKYKIGRMEKTAD